MSKLIPNIGTKIRVKLKKLCLKPETTPNEFLKEVKDKKHRYFSACQTISGEKVAFYARLHDNQDAKRKFINEIRFLKKINENGLQIKNVIPTIYSSGMENSYEWLVRQYPRALPLGHSRQLNKKLPKNLVGQLSKYVYLIAKIPIKKIAPELKKFKPKNYIIAPLYEELVSKHLINAQTAKNIIKMAETNQKLLAEENRYACHGDLNLGNILSEHNKIWIIDWELFHINNFAYDIGYLWAHLWQAPRSFRAALMASYLKKLNSAKLERFKILLPIIAAYLSVGGVSFRKNKNEKLEILRKRKKFYIGMLKNCADKFNVLIKT